MIYSARPTVSHVVNMYFFVFLDIEGRMDGQTTCVKSNYKSVRPCLWVGRVDQQHNMLGGKSRKSSTRNVQAQIIRKVKLVLVGWNLLES